jgi:hypothetical protein
MTKQVFQIHISLRDSRPKIWRRILVISDISLIDFHKIIQTTMGWTNSHLHQFGVGKLIYAPDEFELEDSKDSYKIKLSKVLQKENKKIKYEYDFGDGWIHDILLEKILPFDNTLKLPTLIDGKRNCPPEDCGGIRGYDELLEIISNPKHKEHFEMLEWLGGEFDPEFLGIEEKNELLKEDDYGCIWL